MDLDPQKYAPEELDSAVIAKIQEVTEEIESLLEEGPTGAVDIPTLSDALS